MDNHNGVVFHEPPRRITLEEVNDKLEFILKMQREFALAVNEEFELLTKIINTKSKI